MKLMPAALALAAALTSVSAQATGWTHTKSCWPDCTTTLTFSSLLDLSSKYVYKDTDAGGDATVTPTGGSLKIVGGQLGVYSGLFDSPHIDKGQAITVSFAEAVVLKGFDMDNLFSGNFSLSVDGGAAKNYSLSSYSISPELTGKSFTFGYAGTSYSIDWLKFVCAVPEPGTYGLMLMGLGGLAFVRRRRG